MTLLLLWGVFLLGFLTGWAVRYRLLRETMETERLAERAITQNALQVVGLGPRRKPRRHVWITKVES